MKKPSVLVIDDEEQIRKLLSITLTSNNYEVSEAVSAKEGVQHLLTQPADLVLLDLGLPDQNGQEVLKHLRTWFKNPVIIISVKTDDEEIVEALENGADDYVIKPFRTGELLARIRAALRKPKNTNSDNMFVFDDLTIDFGTRIVKKAGQQLKLTDTEYSLLSLLALNEGKVLTHQYLLTKVWGSSHDQEAQYLRVFISQVRKKIETDPNRPKHIITESGVGYRFLSGQ